MREERVKEGRAFGKASPAASRQAPPAPAGFGVRREERCRRQPQHLPQRRSACAAVRAAVPERGFRRSARSRLQRLCCNLRGGIEDVRAGAVCDVCAPGAGSIYLLRMREWVRHRGLGAGRCPASCSVTRTFCQRTDLLGARARRRNLTEEKWTQPLASQACARAEACARVVQPARLVMSAGRKHLSYTCLQPESDNG